MKINQLDRLALAKTHNKLAKSFRYFIWKFNVVTHTQFVLFCVHRLAIKVQMMKSSSTTMSTTRSTCALKLTRPSIAENQKKSALFVVQFTNLH
jgi:hypothetical protein